MDFVAWVVFETNALLYTLIAGLAGIFALELGLRLRELLADWFGF